MDSDASVNLYDKSIPNWKNKEFKNNDQNFNSLVSYIATLDKSENSNNFVPKLKTLSNSQLNEKICTIEQVYLQLAFDEARTFQRGRVLNILTSDPKIEEKK